MKNLVSSKALQRTLAEACFAGDLKSVRHLIERGARPDRPDDRGYWPLHMACQEGHVEVARLLIKKGADFNRRDENGEVPMHFAVGEGHVRVVELLLRSGYRVNDQSTEGTALHTAAAWNQLRVAKTLIRHGAEVHLLDKSRRTPLFYAKRKGHSEMIDLLLEHSPKTRKSRAPRKRSRP